MVELPAQTLVNQEWVLITGEPKAAVEWSATISDGGDLYMTGNTFDSTQGYDVLVLKLNSQGDTVWQSTYHHPGNEDDMGIALVLNPYGDLYVAAATFRSSDTTADYLLLSFNTSNGSLNWSSTYNGPGNGDDIPADLVSDGTGNLYVTGTSLDSSGDKDVATLKYNKLGSLQWTRRYDHAGYDDGGAKLTFSRGTLRVTGASGQSLTNWDYLSLTYQANGTLKGAKLINNSGFGFDRPAAVAVDEDDNLYITGAASSDGITYQVQTVKLDSNLNQIWLESWGADSVDDGGLDLVLGDSGMVYVAGFATDSLHGGKEQLLLKYNSSGTLQWAKQRPAPTTHSCVAKQIDRLPGNRLVVSSEQFLPTEGTSILTEGFDTGGNLRWQRKYREVGMPAGQALQLSTSGNDTVYVQGILMQGGTQRYAVVKYVLKTRISSIVLDSLGNESHRAQEVIIRVAPAHLIMDRIEKRDIYFGQAKDFIKPGLLSQMETKLGTSGALASSTLIKVYKRLTPQDTISISRSGNEIRIPDFWATFVLEVPMYASRSVLSEIEAADSLHSLNPDIWYAELNYVGQAHTNDTRYVNDEQKGLKEFPNFEDADINMPDAWDLEVGREDIKVGVYDSGIDYTHEDFGNASLGSLQGSKITGGIDFVNMIDFENLADPDPNGHGTACAGIIGAIRNNGQGVAGIAGGDFSLPNGNARKTGVSLQAMLIGDNGPHSVETVADAVVAGATNNPNFGGGLHISNHSYGIGSVSPATGGRYNNLREAFRYAFKNEMVVVASRGNSQTQPNINPQIFYPACFPYDDWVISVGASGADGKLHRSRNAPLSPPENDLYYSRYGDGMEVLAPGATFLVSTTETGSDAYTTFSGTSSSAAHVTGVASLLMSYFNSPTQTLAPEDVEHIIEMSGGGYPNFDLFGNAYGLIDAGKALELLEYPNYQLLHFSGSSSSFTLDGDDVSVELAEGHRDILPGTYVADRYKASVTVNYTLPAGYQIVNHWVRNSSSNLYGNQGSSSLDPLLPGANISFSSVPTTTQATLEGYYYEFPDSVFLPEESVNPNFEGEFAFSLLITNQTVGLNDNYRQADNRVSIFPNPTQSEITLLAEIFQPETIEIQIMNMQGQALFSMKNMQASPGKFQRTISLAGLPTGIYLLLYSDNQGTIQKKIIKQ